MTLLCFDGCPHWRLGHQRLREALEEVGADPEVVEVETIETPEEAERRSFRGSPTFLLNGRDPFARADAPVGLSCRIYPTAEGPAGSPTVAELVAALRQDG